MIRPNYAEFRGVVQWIDGHYICLGVDEVHELIVFVTDVEGIYEGDTIHGFGSIQRNWEYGNIVVAEKLKN